MYPSPQDRQLSCSRLVASLLAFSYFPHHHQIDPNRMKWQVVGLMLHSLSLPQQSSLNTPMMPLFVLYHLELGRPCMAVKPDRADSATVLLLSCICGDKFDASKFSAHARCCSKTLERRGCTIQQRVAQASNDDGYGPVDEKEAEVALGCSRALCEPQLIRPGAMDALQGDALFTATCLQQHRRRCHRRPFPMATMSSVAVAQHLTNDELVKRPCRWTEGSLFEPEKDEALVSATPAGDCFDSATGRILGLFVNRGTFMFEQQAGEPPLGKTLVLNKSSDLHHYLPKARVRTTSSIQIQDEDKVIASSVAVTTSGCADPQPTEDEEDPGGIDAAAPPTPTTIVKTPTPRIRARLRPLLHRRY